MWSAGTNVYFIIMLLFISLELFILIRFVDCYASFAEGDVNMYVVLSKKRYNMPCFYILSIVSGCLFIFCIRTHESNI